MESKSKTGDTITTYAQVLFVVFAFVLMIVSSYIYVRSIEHEHLKKNAEETMSRMQAQIASDLHESEVALENIADVIRNMILRGMESYEIENFIKDMIMNKTQEEQELRNIMNIYGFFDVYGGEFYSGIDQGFPSDYAPSSTWYKAALDVKNKVAVIDPYFDASFNSVIISYARRIFDNNGKQLAIICLDVKFDKTTKRIANTQFNGSGFGVLLNKKLEIIAHQFPKYLGENLYDVNLGITQFADDLKKGLEIFEHEIINYKDEESIVFLKPIENDLVIGLVAPKKEYYENLTKMAIFLTALGTALMIILSIILIRLNRAKWRANELAKAEAESASKAKSAFLAKMSHEIRTPMNAILGTAEIQLQNETLDPKIREPFMMIYNSSNLLLGIINNILDLSKIEAGRMELMLAKYDISSLINDAVQLNIIRNKNKRIKFELSIGENIPLEFNGDEIRIKQILNNLLSNAFKYTKKGKVELSISAENNGNSTTLVFKVSDTGQGMTAEQASKLFTSEYIRFNMEANRLIEGTGLGISIVYHLVQMMQGVISVESELGKGSAFIVRLPQKRVSLGTLSKEMVENLQNFRTKFSSQMKKLPFLRENMSYGKVLVVDDVESNLYVANGLMTPYGLTIETASSGFQAIDKIKEGNVYDIIFMDHMMPKMDGIEATKAIRKLGYKHPVVALTANALLGQAKIFFDNGFNDFIPKPIDTRQLNAVLNKFIRNKHSSETVNLPDLFSIFALDAKKMLPILESTLKNIANASDEDLSLYTISAHGLKSALANIGESELSNMALALEMAGKEQNRSVIESDTQKLIDAVKEIAAKAEKNENPSDKDEDPAFLRKQLEAICEYCENYDARSASLGLAALKEMQWAGKTKDILEQINGHLLLSDFEEAKAGILEFLGG